MPRAVSREALRLRALAREVAREIVGRYEVSVALTGSAARGDAEPGSDIDLWVVGLPEQRRSTTVRGVSVTLLCQPLRDALAFENLCYWEVRDLVVLEDPHRAFAKLQARFRKLAPRIDRAILDATFEVVELLLKRAPDAEPVERVALLREAAYRIAAGWMYRRGRWRVPRVRAFRTHLPPRAFRALRRGLGLGQSRRIAPLALRRWPAVARAFGVPRGGKEREARHKLEAGRFDDALLVLRRHFALEVGTRLAQATPAQRRLAGRYAALLQGIGGETARAEQAAKSALAVLRVELALDRFAPAAVLRLLETVRAPGPSRSSRPAVRPR